MPRTLLAGELEQSQSYDSEYYVKLEVQNASGTWIDVGALLGKNWIVNVVWGEDRDTSVSQATFTLVMAVGSASLAPLMTGSALNVDDLLDYAPLLKIGRLFRSYTATMPKGVALDPAKYRPAITGRIDDVLTTTSNLQGLGPVTLLCSDLGGWLMDLQIETEGTQYGDPVTPPTLLSVLQAVTDGNIPVGEPAVTVVKQSTSNFAVTDYRQGETKLLDSLINLVLDSTGEDLRYRFDASHVSQLMWFNPDRNRVTVDATFAKGKYVMRRLDTSLADIRNAGELAYTEAGVAGVVTAENGSSIQDHRRRFFRLSYNKGLATEAEAQAVIDAVVYDLSEPPAEAEVELPFCWFVQLFDRYTFAADDELYDEDQTFAVGGYRHAIENGRGSTVLTPLTARTVGAYERWRKRITTRDEFGLPTLEVRLLEGGTPDFVQYSPIAAGPFGEPVTIYYAFGEDPFVLTVASGGVVSIPRATNDSGDRALTFKAVGANGASVSQTVTVDYDSMPELAITAERVPIYSAGEQVGWRIRGTADDDARAVTVAIAGDLSIQSATSSPGVFAGAVYWIDTRTVKTWSVDILQSAGQTGTATLTAREFYDSGAGGLGGQPAIITLSRGATTSHSIRDLTATIREFTISAIPTTATIKYRIDGGTWQERTGGTTTFSVDVGSASAVVEYYSYTASGVVEAIKRIVVDQNSQPGITSLSALESSANNGRITAGFDDDVTRWAVWVRPSLYPTLTGTLASASTEEPLERYKKYDGGLEVLSIDFRVVTVATWYGILRAHDKNGVYVQQTFSFVVSGAPPATGALSNLIAQHNTETALHYNDIIWNHNQEVQDTAHTVTIRESDNGAAFVQLVSGRDAKTEHDGGGATALLGGYHTQKPWVAPGTPGAVFHTYDYQVDLRKTAGDVFVAAYSISMTGWEAGGGGGGGGAAPTEIPTTLAAFGEVLKSRGTWVNTSSEWSIHVEWEKNSVLQGPLDNGPGKSTHTLTGLIAGDSMRFRVRYFNGYGNGTWSAWSNTVIVLPAGSPPTEIPSSLIVISNVGWTYARANWTNTSSAYQLHYEWEKWNGSIWVSLSSGDLAANTAVHQSTSGHTPGDTLRFRCRYFNEIGNGTYTDWDEAVIGGV